MRFGLLILSCSLHTAAIAAAVGVAVHAGRRLHAPLPQVRIESSVASSPALPESPPLPPIVVEAVADEPLPIELPLPPLVAEPLLPADASHEPRPRIVVPPTMRWRVPAAATVAAPPVVAPSEVPVVAKAIESVSQPQVDAERCADNPPPNYPEEARRRGQQGTVVVAVAVDAAGVVVSATLQAPSPHPALNREALRAVRSWRFEPARRDGQAIATTTEVVIEFQLEQAAGPR